MNQISEADKLEALLSATFEELRELRNEVKRLREEMSQRKIFDLNSGAILCTSCVERELVENGEKWLERLSVVNEI